MSYSVEQRSLQNQLRAIRDFHNATNQRINYSSISSGTSIGYDGITGQNLYTAADGIVRGVNLSQSSQLGLTIPSVYNQAYSSGLSGYGQSK
jgi:hypothetical protein